MDQVNCQDPAEQLAVCSSAVDPPRCLSGMISERKKAKIVIKTIYVHNLIECNFNYMFNTEVIVNYHATDVSIFTFLM